MRRQRSLDDSTKDALLGFRILVVEDEYFLADDITIALRARGAEVIGPVGDVDEALGKVESRGPIDGAVLDINLREEMAYPIADVLRARNIPFILTTGYDRRTLPEPYRNVLICEKPFDPRALAIHMQKLLTA